jgi:hypothetical protein
VNAEPATRPGADTDRSLARFPLFEDWLDDLR